MIAGTRIISSCADTSTSNFLSMILKIIVFIFKYSGCHVHHEIRRTLDADLKRAGVGCDERAVMPTFIGAPQVRLISEVVSQRKKGKRFGATVKDLIRANGRWSKSPSGCLALVPHGMQYRRYARSKAGYRICRETLPCRPWCTFLSRMATVVWDLSCCRDTNGCRKRPRRFGRAGQTSLDQGRTVGLPGGDVLLVRGCLLLLYMCNTTASWWSVISCSSRNVSLSGSAISTPIHKRRSPP